MSSVRPDGTFTIKAGGQGGSIFLTASNSCGAATSQNDVVLTGCSGYRYTYSPNPTSSELTIVALDANQPDGPGPASVTAPPFEVELLDSCGKQVRTSKNAQGKVQLDVRELPAGLYQLRAGKGKEALSKRIQITR